MSHMLRENAALLIGRQAGVTGSEDYDIVWIAADIVDFNYFRRGGEVLFPLYRYEPDKTENLSPDFRAFIDRRYQHQYTPEEILGYIYAVRHAPTYREKYAEFLRIDFPRIPFPEKSAAFETMSDLGWDLIQKHLLRDVPDKGLAKYPVKGDNEVEKPRYSEVEQAIYINDAQKFAPVPKDVWEFHIGGYQVLSKFLKDRKGRTLTLDEINNVENVANVLAFTIEQMARIDEAYLAAFPQTSS